MVQVQKSTKYYLTKIRKNQSYGVIQDINTYKSTLIIHKLTESGDSNELFRTNDVGNQHRECRFKSGSRIWFRCC